MNQEKEGFLRRNSRGFTGASRRKWRNTSSILTCRIVELAFWNPKPFPEARQTDHTRSKKNKHLFCISKSSGTPCTKIKLRWVCEEQGCICTTKAERVRECSSDWQLKGGIKRSEVAAESRIWLFKVNCQRRYAMMDS